MMSWIKLKRSAVLMFVLLTTYAAPVLAGFEWKGSASLSQPAVVSQETIQWDKNSTTMPLQKMPVIESTPVSLIASPTHRNAIPLQKSLPENDIVAGFGTGLPLVVALQQVIPEGYQFLLADGANPDTVVSWEGGRSWKQILTGMLAAQDLGFHLRNDTVTVGPFTNAPLTNERQPAPASLSRADIIPADTSSCAGKQKTAVIHPEPSADTGDRAQQLTDRLMEAQESMLPPAIASHDTAAAKLTFIESGWRAAKGQTLRSVLTDWSKTEGVDLYWSLDYDYRLNENVTYNGRFEESVGRILDYFAKVRPQPYGQLHLTSGGPRVLVINSYDLTN